MFDKINAIINVIVTLYYQEIDLKIGASVFCTSIVLFDFKLIKWHVLILSKINLDKSPLLEMLVCDKHKTFYSQCYNIIIYKGHSILLSLRNTGRKVISKCDILVRFSSRAFLLGKFELSTKVQTFVRARREIQINVSHSNMGMTPKSETVH